MSIIAIGGGDLTDKIFNKILSMVSHKTKGDLYIGLITDASFMTPHKNTSKVINGFNKQQRNYRIYNIKIQSIRLLDYKYKRTELYRFIQRTDILFITGGHQHNIYNNIQTLKQNNINVRKYLIDFLHLGKILVGTSAGASILGTIMPPSLGPGIGLVKTIIDQHFITNRRFHRGLDFIRKKPKMGLIGIDEDTMVIHKYKSGHRGKRYYKVFGDRMIVIIENTGKNIRVKILKQSDGFYI